MKKRREPKARGKRAAEVIRLADLAPQKAVKGGRRLLFGERLDAPEDEARPAPKNRSKPPTERALRTPQPDRKAASNTEGEEAGGPEYGKET